MQSAVEGCAQRTVAGCVQYVRARLLQAACSHVESIRSHFTLLHLAFGVAVPQIAMQRTQPPEKQSSRD